MKPSQSDIVKTPEQPRKALEESVSNEIFSDESSSDDEDFTIEEIEVSHQPNSVADVDLCQLANTLRAKQQKQDKELWSVLKHREARTLFKDYLKKSHQSQDEITELLNYLSFYLEVRNLNIVKLSPHLCNRKMEKINKTYLAEDAPSKVHLLFELTSTNQVKMYSEARYSVVGVLNAKMEDFKKSTSFQDYHSHRLSTKLKKIFKNERL